MILGKFFRLAPPRFFDACEFLISYNDRLHNLGLVNTCGIDYTTFQFYLVAPHQQRGHLDSKQVESPILKQTQFSKVFLEKYMPYSCIDHLRYNFSRLNQGAKDIMDFKAKFNELSRNATSIQITKNEWFLYFLGQLEFFLQGYVEVISMAFSEVFGHAQDIEGFIVRPKGPIIRGCNIRVVLVGSLVAEGSAEIVCMVGTLCINIISIRVSRVCPFMPYFRSLMMSFISTMIILARVVITL